MAAAVVAEADGSILNEAIVFLKPHADSDRCEAVVRAALLAAGCAITSTRRIGGAEIEDRKLIDAHYGSLAEAAMATPPSAFEVGAAKAVEFEAAFGVSWAAARKVLNPLAMAELRVDGAELEKMWRSGPCVKLAPGTYVAELVGAPTKTFTVNGFYPAMRAEFVAPGAALRVFEIAFPRSAMSWAEFRDVVVGPTDPAAASPKSLRGAFRKRWVDLGLATEPKISCNCVHASAGPLEGLKEREVWAGADVEADPLGSRLIAKLTNRFTLPPRDGAAVLRGWLDTNPAYQLKPGEEAKIFDATEGMDAQDLLDLCPSPL